MNAITIYLASAIFRIQRQADRFVGGDFAGALGSWAALVKSLVALTLILAIARFLYRRKIFLRL
jgi:hypothetical protein